jgi:16S rRNA (cytidine1402-2'-O)-methyltransferase
VSGKLFVVATPIGNLDDISARALEVLRTVDLVVCEDTRRTAKLLDRYGIDARMLSCHRFNERSRLEPVLDRIRAGERVALVSDGGTPAIADPGVHLVATVLAERLEVSPLPGPNAVAALLSASGLPADRYVFDGFLPHRAGERRRRLRALAEEPRTVVLFETPHRIRQTLADIEEVLGPRPVVLGRELTKLHEAILRGSAAELAARLGSGPVRGEITLVLAGCADRRQAAGDEGAHRLLACWRKALEQAGGNRRLALERTARELGLRKPELSRRLAELGQERP